MIRAPGMVLLLGLCAGLSAKPLDELPARWAAQLAAIPPQRLDELDPASTARIRETRERLDAMLSADDASSERLAALYGRLGALYAAHRLYAGAELALGNARALDPHGLQWAYYAAHIALEQGEPTQALDRLAEAAQIDPDFPSLALRRGEALLGLNRLAEARAAYRQAVDQPALRAAALYGLGQIDLLERDWAGAADKLGEVLKLQPQADAVNYPLGQALLRLDRRDEARAHLAQRGTIKPDYVDPLIKELRSLQAGARLHFEQGVAAVKRSDYASAATAFAAGLAEEPANVRARTSYARALWLSGQQAEAQQQLQQAIDGNPGETLPRFLLAVVLDAAGDQQAAGGHYREVLAIDPDHEGALSYLANLELRRANYAEAATHFEHAIASGVTQMPVYLHFWGALRQAGTDDAQLRDRLIAFDQRFPEPPVFRFLLARLLATSAQGGVTDVARATAIARDLQAAQPIPPHTELLALTLAAAGDFAQAEELIQGLLEMAKMTGAWMQVGSLEQTLAGYRAGRRPEPAWAPNDPMFLPPPPDPESAMRNYPAGRPY